MSLAQRLAAKLQPSDGGCIVYTGAHDKGGYGTIREAGRGSKMLRTHRVAWQLAHPGEDLPKLLRHSCDNPPCCNVEHLLPGNHSSNGLDMFERGLSTQVGENHKNATLTDEQVAELRARYAAGGISQRALGAEYGISGPSVHALVHHRFR